MTPTDTTPQIASLSTEEKLKLMEVLAEDIWQAYPDSLILPQIIRHARDLQRNKSEATTNYTKKPKFSGKRK
jgi:hypothetical protein